MWNILNSLNQLFKAQVGVNTRCSISQDCGIPKDLITESFWWGWMGIQMCKCHNKAHRNQVDPLGHKILLCLQNI
ncbi:hypothetical protein UPYG_G00157180 [Umbra pygmaea]|uniref:Uncharacterized protein n=1 Tax=Umbra pygmaea TaxID=75934 RepID=A0ABD0X2L7_UMBPY